MTTADEVDLTKGKKHFLGTASHNSHGKEGKKANAIAAVTLQSSLRTRHETLVSKATILFSSCTHVYKSDYREVFLFFLTQLPSTQGIPLSKSERLLHLPIMAEMASTEVLGLSGFLTGKDKF